MKNIGPTFGRELAAAGLSGLAFVWYSDGSIDFRELSPIQCAAVQAVYDAHDPARVIAPTNGIPMPKIYAYLATLPNCPQEIKDAANAAPPAPVVPSAA